MIITGAPVEHLEFEQVDYWDELCMIMEWSKKNVYSTFHICWGAQAGLYRRVARARGARARGRRARLADGQGHGHRRLAAGV